MEINTISETKESVDNQKHSLVEDLTYIPSHPVHVEENISSSKESCEEIWNGTLCSSIDLDIDMFDKFVEKVCKRCKAYSHQFQLISKKQIQSEYLLTEDSISLMPFVTKDNPYNANWTSMKMYLRKHAYIKAMKRFGTEESLSKEIEKRKNEQFQRELKKSSNMFTTTQKSESSMFGSATGSTAGSGSTEGSGSGSARNDEDLGSNKKRKLNKNVKKMSGLISSIRGDKS